MKPAPQRFGVALAWLAMLVAALALLGGLGHGSLSRPPIGDRDQLQDWLAARDAAEVAFALLRLAAVATTWYLLVVSVVGLVARATRLPALVSFTDLATVPFVRRILGGIAGLSITATAVTFVATAPLERGGSASSEAASHGPSGGSVLVLERLPASPPLVLERLGHDSDDHHGGTATLRVVELTPAPPAPPPSQATAGPGDSLWGMAATTLRSAWGREPTDAELTPYWEATVEANRTRLADPANPDLIFNGQRFDLPPAPPDPQ